MDRVELIVMSDYNRICLTECISSLAKLKKIASTAALIGYLVIGEVEQLVPHNQIARLLEKARICSVEHLTRKSGDMDNFGCDNQN